MATEANPRKTFDFFLDPDTDKPPAQRRALVCRFLTTGEFHEKADEFDNALDALGDNPTSVELGKKIATILETIIVGWRNIKGFDGVMIAYSPGAILMLSRSDFKMARNDLLEAMEVAEDDLKKLLSPVRSDTGASAPGAEAGSV